MDDEKYLDRFENSLVGEMLYVEKNIDREDTPSNYFIPFSRSSNVDDIWYAMNVRNRTTEPFDVIRSRNLEPTYKEICLREIEDESTNAKKLLSRVKDHESVPNFFDRMNRIRELNK